MTKTQSQKYKHSKIWSEALPRDVDGVEAWMTNKEAGFFRGLIKGRPTYLEIGTHQGYSAQLARTEGCAVASIDILTPPNWKDLYDDKILMITGESHKVYYMIQHELMDILYIDGATDLNDVFQDFMLYYPKVKPGGLIIFHNYKIKAGVTQTVDFLKNIYLFDDPYESLIFMRKPEE